jgi:hypothetical protein
MTAIACEAVGCTFLESLDGLTGAEPGDGGSYATPDVLESEQALVPDALGADTALGGDVVVPDAGAAADVTHGSDAHAPVDAGEDVRAPADAANETSVGPVSCTGAGVILCEDFEHGLDSNTWPTVNSTNASVVVDTSNAHRGTQSLHVTGFAVAPAAAPAMVDGTIVHPATLPSTVYMRAFMFFSAVPPSVSEGFMGVQQNHSPYGGLQVELQAGNWAVTDWAASPNFNDDNGGPASGQQWHCVEWLVQQNAGAGAIDIWVDGQELTGLKTSNLYVPDIEQMPFGLSFYNVPAQPQYEAWVDDIYVDTSPVGCAK